jgi:hypothetical protein
MRLLHYYRQKNIKQKDRRRGAGKPDCFCGGIFSMRSDTLIKSDGMRILAETLGIVEAERFITLVLREPFDYTEWQRTLYGNMDVKELYDKISAFEVSAQ